MTRKVVWVGGGGKGEHSVPAATIIRDLRVVDDTRYLQAADVKLRFMPVSPTIRRATLADLPAIIAMLADDPLGATREDPGSPLNPAYLAAFEAIEADPNQFLAVMEHNGGVVGTLQLTVLPGLARKGAWRAQIEAVRVRADQRDTGLGQQLFDWAIAEARRRDCHLVQLTTDKARPDAHRFYERLGFRATHEGYKLIL